MTDVKCNLESLFIYESESSFFLRMDNCRVRDMALIDSSFFIPLNHRARLRKPCALGSDCTCRENSLFRHVSGEHRDIFKDSVSIEI